MAEELELPPDVREEREINARASAIIRSMSFDIYSGIIAASYSRTKMNKDFYEKAVEASFNAVQEFAKRAGL